LVNTILVGIATTTFLNKTKTGETIKNQVLKPAIKQIKEYVSPIKQLSTINSIAKKESLFKRTIKKIRDFSPLKRFMSKGGEINKNSRNLKSKTKKNII